MYQFRTMNMSDLPQVVKFITDFDEDDGKEAEEDFHESGFDNQYVIEVDEKVVGVSGFRLIPAADNAAWLSWTYVDCDYRRQGLGKKMLQDLILVMREMNVRKVFVKVSDYCDPEDGAIYESAEYLYKSVGFKLEVKNVDFYDVNESQFILGLSLIEDDNEEVEITEEKPAIHFISVIEIAETEGSYTFEWDVKKKTLFGKGNFTVLDLQVGFENVLNRGGRKVFLTFPSNLPLIHPPLKGAGFKYVGQLQDYYEKGIHEYHFVYDLPQT
ncbi:GNAT family N-acetyltransferase [Marinicellulosiphila megalodicopiae]|uniref:GNAT family N-acetyltransferase n=1 Tax=Marinicellulosiphila megalodicopiae TaxID=2724896 RepID=UPI003BB10131